MFASLQRQWGIFCKDVESLATTALANLASTNDAVSPQIINELARKLKTALPHNEFTVRIGTHAPTTPDTFGPPLSDTQVGITVAFDHLGLTNSAAINRRDVEQLFTFLKTHTQITSLIANGSFIDESGATAIADFLKTNTTLRVLDLNSCHISEAGVLAIVEALRSNCNLQFLNLRANAISDTVLKDVLSVLKSQNKSLQQIELTQNRFDDEIALDQGLVQAIYAQLHLNKSAARVVAQEGQSASVGAPGARRV